MSRALGSISSLQLRRDKTSGGTRAPHILTRRTPVFPLGSLVVPSNAKSAAPQSSESLAFEEAVKKLEKIVEEMESGELPLESMLSRFEEGTRLVKVCQGKLEEAELKIQKLEKNSAGEISVKPVQIVED
jgi:exodeoxyribonuclease VII small subunit